MQGVWDPARKCAKTPASALNTQDLLCARPGARESVRFLPPLTVSEGEIEEALSIFGDCLTDVFGASSSAARAQHAAAA